MKLATTLLLILVEFIYLLPISAYVLFDFQSFNAETLFLDLAYSRKGYI